MKKRSQGAPPQKKSKGILAEIGSLLQRTALWRYTGVVLGSVYFVFASLITFKYHRILDYGMESDFLFEYVPIAKQVAHGSLPIPLYRGPVYPVLLQAVKAITGDYFTAGLIIGLLAASVTLAFSFALIRKLFKAEIALGVVVLMTVSPYFFMYTYQVGTDMLFGALTTASLFFLLGTAEMNWKRLSVSAVLGALAYLTRYNGIFILSASALILLTNPWKLDWRKRSFSAVLFATVFFAAIAPWGIYCLKEKGSFFYSENKQNIAFDIYAKNQMSREDFFFKGNPFEGMSIPDLVRYNPPMFFGALASNCWNHGVKTVKTQLGWVTGVLALSGLVLLLVRKMTSYQATYLLINLAFFLALSPVHFEIRYPLFMLGGLLTLAVCGVLLVNLNIGKPLVRILSVAALLALVIYTGSNSYATNSVAIGSGPAEVIALSDSFKANVPPEKRGVSVAARKPHIAYYMGLEYVPLPAADSPNELIRQLKEQNVSYLYFGRMEYLFRPQLRGLIDVRQQWPGLRKVATSDQPFSVLYKIE
jgi:hypothetical protein